MTTKIEWADLTLNPVVGCSKCSPGCANCYAERLAAMRVKHPNPKISGKYAGTVDEHGKWTGKLNCDLSVFDNLPKSPKRIFVGSMTDLFHENADIGSVDRTFLAMSKHPSHAFMVLTKRHDRMRAYVSASCDNRRIGAPQPWPLPNVWLGVTICNQAEADEKIPALLDTPAAKRFVSVEPMLGPVDLEAVLYTHSPGFFGDALKWHHLPHCRRDELQGGAVYPALDWVICGGETGFGARPMHPDWVRGLRDQCVAAGVPFFFKGWGEWIKVEYKDYPDWQRRDRGRGIFSNLDPVRGWFWNLDAAWRPDGQGGMKKIYGTDLMHRINKRRTGRLLDGREWNEVPS